MPITKNPERRVNECLEQRDSNFKIFEFMQIEFYKEPSKSYEDINLRATKYFKKRGCYYF